MKKNYLILLGFCFLSFLSSAQERGSKMSNSYLEITEEEKVKLVPDEIYLRITLDEKDSKGKMTIEEAETKMKLLLKKHGINLKNLSVTYTSSDFHKRFFGKDIYVLKEYELKTSSAQEMSKVVQLLQENGVSNIALSKIDYSKKEEIKSQLQAKALVKAKQKAAYLASSIGEKIGKPISIYIQKNYDAPTYRSWSLSYKSSSGESEKLPDTEYRTITIKAEITVKFEIE